MLIRICYIYLLTMLVVPFAAFAATQQNTSQQQPIYKVELIIFAHVTAQGLLSEDWPSPPELPNMQRVYELKPLQQPIALPQQNATPSPQSKPTQLYQILPSSTFDLAQAVMKLKANGNYPILVHVAWLQPGLPVRNSRRIHIYGGQAYTATGQLAEAISPLNASASSANLLPSPNTDIQWQLNGYVRVSKPYLFQLHADLVLTIPPALLERVSAKAANQLKTHQFILQQTFRMRLGQLYYIDQPLFGILAEVTTYSK